MTCNLEVRLGIYAQMATPELPAQSGDDRTLICSCFPHVWAWIMTQGWRNGEDLETIIKEGFGRSQNHGR